MEMLNSIFEIKARLGWAGAGWAGQTARCVRVQVSISSTGNMGYSDSGLFSLTPGQGDTAAAEDEDGVMMMVTICSSCAPGTPTLSSQCAHGDNVVSNPQLWLLNNLSHGFCCLQQFWYQFVDIIQYFYPIR